jgi:transcriptional regulator with XRE-family HTH domain
MTNRRPLDALHELMDADAFDNENTDSTFKDTEGPDDRDDLLNEALAHTGLDALSPEAQRYLLALTTDSASVEPDTRQKLVDAASRGIQHHRNDSSALPRLLFVQRRALRSSLEDVAERIGVPADQLAAVERGRERIETLTAPKVAAWISVLGVSSAQARASIGRALELQRREDLAVAAAATDVSTTDDDFIEEVIAHLPAEQR